MADEHGSDTQLLAAPRTDPHARSFEEFAVHVDDALRSSLLVKVIHILRTEKQAVFQPPLQFRQREMSRVWLGCRSDPATHGVELPYEKRIATPRVGRGEADPLHVQTPFACRPAIYLFRCQSPSVPVSMFRPK
jgi:hypothetical protein